MYRDKGLPRCQSQCMVNIIVNPKAGGYSHRRMDRIQAHPDVSANIIETGYRGHARAIVRDLSPELPVYVAGGDGTVNEVVNGLMDARKLGRTIPPMGIIPMGTANVLAHEIQVEKRITAIVDYIRDPVVMDVFPGMANGCAFMLMAGAGSDAVTVANVSARLKLLLGKWAYVWQGLYTISNPPDRMLSVTIDGNIHQAAGVIVTRARHYGGRYVLSPDAGIWLPRLVVVLLPSHKTRDLLRYAMCLVLGKLDQQSDIHIAYGTDVTIECADPNDQGPLQIDGDYSSNLPCKVSLAPHAIKLLIPSDFKQTGRP